MASTGSGGEEGAEPSIRATQREPGSSEHCALSSESRRVGAALLGAHAHELHPSCTPNSIQQRPTETRPNHSPTARAHATVRPRLRPIGRRRKNSAAEWLGFSGDPHRSRPHSSILRTVTATHRWSSRSWNSRPPAPSTLCGSLARIQSGTVGSTPFRQPRSSQWTTIQRPVALARRRRSNTNNKKTRGTQR